MWYAGDASGLTPRRTPSGFDVQALLEYRPIPKSAPFADPAELIPVDDRREARLGLAEWDGLTLVPYQIRPSDRAFHDGHTSPASRLNARTVAFSPSVVKRPR